VAIPKVARDTIEVTTGEPKTPAEAMLPGKIEAKLVTTVAPNASADAML
jgi:hypothetical protein